MDKVPFVDTYIHFIDLANPKLRYFWLEPDARDPRMGDDLERLKGKNHVVDEYLEESRDSNVLAVVHVDAGASQDKEADAVAETTWLQAEADRTGFPQAMMPYTDLMDPQVARTLDRHLQFPNFKGVRFYSDGSNLDDPAFLRGFALVDKLGLTCDMSVRGPDMAKARDLAKRFPDTPMVLVHCGYPWDRTEEGIQAWKRYIATIAQAENVICKIDSLTLVDHQWTVDSLRPWILTCIETFGAKRCVFASHWPIDTMWGGFPKLVDAYREVVRDFSLEEQTDLLSGNALRAYRITV